MALQPVVADPWSMTLYHPLILGFSGAAKSGKDTAAKAISSLVKGVYGIEVEHLSFASPIREICKVFGYTDKQLDSQSLKETYMGNKITNVSPRKFMQLVGTDMFRNVLDKDIWVRMLESKIQEPIDAAALRTWRSDEIHWNPRKAYFITDVRFSNESLMVKRHQGFVIRVERPDLVPSGDWRKHESEKAISDILPDLVWTNDSPSALQWCGKALKLFDDMIQKNRITLG